MTSSHEHDRRRTLAFQAIQRMLASEFVIALGFDVTAPAIDLSREQRHVLAHLGSESHVHHRHPELCKAVIGDDDALTRSLAYEISADIVEAVY